jgi:hypothetical protein
MSDFDDTHLGPHEENPGDHGHLPPEPDPHEPDLHEPGPHDVELPAEAWPGHPDEAQLPVAEQPDHEERPAEPAGYEEPAASGWSDAELVGHEVASGGIFDVHPEHSLAASIPSTHEVDEALRADHATSWSATGFDPTTVETDGASAALLADLEPQPGASTVHELTPSGEWGAQAARLWTMVTGEPAPGGVPHDTTQTIELLRELTNQPCDPLDADVVQQMLNALDS